MPLRIEITTSETEKDNTAYIHVLDQKEGQSLVDVMYDAIEAAVLLYSSDGIVSINLVPTEDD